jgi:hypothetical protein
VNNFNQLTAISLRLVEGVLKNARYNLNPGSILDVPTAQDEIEQAMAKLDQIATILEHPKGCPTVDLTVEVEVDPACDCYERNLQYICCESYFCETCCERYPKDQPGSTTTKCKWCKGVR